MLKSIMFKTLFTASMFFCLNAQSNELFGYKLYEDILKYENDGSIKLKKGNIESISIKAVSYTHLTLPTKRIV